MGQSTQGVALRNHLIRDAIHQALYDRMKADDSVVILGEGAVMKMHYDAPAIEREFPERIVTLPISEDGNTNFAVGMALLGVKPVVDVITSDFLFRTMDSICNTAAKINFVSGESDSKKTIVVRAEFLMAGPTTGQRLESLFTHVPGLDVVIPSTPLDARGLMTTALTKGGVTIFFEDRMIPDSTTKKADLAPTESVPIAFGRARVRHEDSGVTIVSYASTLRQIETLVDSKKVRCDLIDLRSIYPVDYETIFSSVRRTGRLLIVEPDVTYAGVGAEIAATVSEKCWEELEKPVRRLGTPRETIPASTALHKYFVPSDSQILSAVRALM